MFNRLRFSLTSLLACVFAIALACAAIRSASALWASVVFTACLAVLLFGVLAVLFLRGHARSYWTGFCVFGFAYLLLAFGPWFGANVKDHLITSKLLDFAFKQLESHESAAASLGVGAADLNEDGMLDLYVSNDMTARLFRNLGDGTFADVRTVNGSSSGRTWRDFERIGHSLFALLFAMIGGVLATSLWRMRAREPGIRSASGA